MNEAAFNRAFKRIMGVTPGRWRDGRILLDLCAGGLRLAVAAKKARPHTTFPVCVLIKGRRGVRGP